MTRSIETSVAFGIHRVLSEMRRERGTFGYGSVTPDTRDRMLQEELDLGTITGERLFEMVEAAVKDATEDILQWEYGLAERVLADIDAINRDRIDSFGLHQFIAMKRKEIQEKRDKL